MTERAPENAAERIDRALARIEIAAGRVRRSRQALAERHARLRERVGAAIAELDTVIAAGADD